MRNLVIACLFFGVVALQGAPASAGEPPLGGVQDITQAQAPFVVDLEVGAAARGEAVIPLYAPTTGTVSSAFWLELRASTDAAEEAPGMRPPWLGLEGTLWSNLAAGATEQGAGFDGDWRLAFEQEAQAHLLWLHVAERASFNRRAGLSERFGRGRAGDLSLGYEVALQPFFLGQEGWTPEGFLGISFRADYGVSPRKASAPHAGPPFAWELNMDFVEWVWDGPVRPARLELFRFGLAQAGVPTQTRCDADGCVEDGVGVFGLQLDAVDFDGGDLDVLGFTWGAYAGFDVLAPISAYHSTTTVNSSADAVDVEHAVESSGPASPRAANLVAHRPDLLRRAARRGRDPLQRRERAAAGLGGDLSPLRGGRARHRRRCGRPPRGLGAMERFAAQPRPHRADLRRPNLPER